MRKDEKYGLIKVILKMPRTIILDEWYELIFLTWLFNHIDAYSHKLD